MIKTILYQDLINGDTDAIDTLVSGFANDGAVYLLGTVHESIATSFKKNMLRLFTEMTNEQKMVLNTTESNGSRGYVPSEVEYIEGSSVSEKRESFRFGEPIPLMASIPVSVDFDITHLPEGLSASGLTRLCNDYYDSTVSIGIDVLRILAYVYQNHEVYKKALHGNHVVSAQYYPNGHHMNSQEHYDKGYLGVLYEPPKGLEYEYAGVWHKVPTYKGGMLLSVGRSLSIDIPVKSFFHRVRATGSKRYISITFINPNKIIT